MDEPWLLEVDMDRSFREKAGKRRLRNFHVGRKDVFELSLDNTDILESEELLLIIWWQEGGIASRPTMSEMEEEEKFWESCEVHSISVDLTKRNVFIFFGISRHKISKKRESGCFNSKTLLV